jgi:hypothetical protein
MAGLKKCEFFLLRYVPDAIKDEFVNIGLVMVAEADANMHVFTELRFTRDWARVRCMDPDADLEMLQALETDLRQQLGGDDGSREMILKKLQDSFSNTLQLSPTKACLTESPRSEVEILAKQYLESAPGRRNRTDRSVGARLRIAGQMRKIFEDAGVWQLMLKKIEVANYTGAGDTLKIDCGYKPNGVVRMFHAVSLATSIDSAKVLAFSYPQLKDGIANQMHATSELTAIVEDDLDRNDEEVSFGIKTLERSSIAIATVGDLDKIAEQARRELRV